VHYCCVCVLLINYLCQRAWLRLLEILEILEIYLIFSTGNPGILLEFYWVSWKFHGAMAVVAIGMMQRWMSMRFSAGDIAMTLRCHRKNRINCVHFVFKMYLKYLLETPGNLLEFCFHYLLDTLYVVALLCLSVCFLIDGIIAMMLVCRLGGKIIRTVLCCVVYDSFAQCYAHTCEQFLNLPVGL